MQGVLSGNWACQYAGCLTVRELGMTVYRVFLLRELDMTVYRVFCQGTGHDNMQGVLTVMELGMTICRVF